MKVVITRTNHSCSFERCCFGKNLERGSVAVCILYKRGERRRVIYFHPECHTQSILAYQNKEVKEKEEILARRRARESGRPKGRPRKYSDRLEAMRLNSLLYYHRKAGNLEEAGRIQNKLKELEVG